MAVQILHRAWHSVSKADNSHIAADQKNTDTKHSTYFSKQIGTPQRQNQHGRTEQNGAHQLGNIEHGIEQRRCSGDLRRQSDQHHHNDLNFLERSEKGLQSLGAVNGVVGFPIGFWRIDSIDLK